LARSIVSALRDRDRVTLRKLLPKYRVDQKQLHRGMLRNVMRAISIDQQGAVAAFGTYRNLVKNCRRLKPVLMGQFKLP
jgi:hypothetical protein